MNPFAIIDRVARIFRRRNYHAAGSSGRWPASATMIAQPSAALAARPRMAGRATWLIANAPIAAAIVNTEVTNLVGDGPSVQPAHGNRAMRRALQSAWNKFFRRCDIEGGDLVSLLSRVVRSLWSDGEAFVRMITTESSELRLQLLPASQIDASLSREMANGHRIVHGIELGPNGERLAYWVLPESPDGGSAALGKPAVRIEAGELLHVYQPTYAGAVRGTPWLGPVMTQIVELDLLQDAALKKAQTTALVAGFISSTDGTADGFGDASKTDPSELSLEPGTMRRLPLGTSVTFTPTSDMSGLPAFITHVARSISAGAGVPHVLVSDDLSDVNFSSARTGLQNYWRRCTAVRASLLTGRFLDAVWQRFVLLEVLSGRLNTSDYEANGDAYSATFLWPQPASLNPRDDTESEIAAMKARLRSRSEIISARGRDVADVDEEIADDHYADELSAPTEKENPNANAA